MSIQRPFLPGLSGLSGMGLPVAGGDFWDDYTTGLVARYDASDATNLIVANSKVSQATDLSGNSRHAVQADSTLQPDLVTVTGSLTGIQGNFASDPFKRLLVAGSLAIDGPHVIFAVIKVPEGTALRYLCGPTYSRLGISNTNDRRRMQATSTNEADPAYAANTLEIWYATFNVTGGNVGTMYVNGTLRLNATVGAVNQDTSIVLLAGSTGGSSPTDGILGEYVRWNQLLSTADANAIGEYLADKWGLTWTPIS